MIAGCIYYLSGTEGHCTFRTCTVLLDRTTTSFGDLDLTTSPSFFRCRRVTTRESLEKGVIQKNIRIVATISVEAGTVWSSTFSSRSGSSQHTILISTILCDGAAKIQEHVTKISYPDYSVLFALRQVTVEYMRFLVNRYGRTRVQENCLVCGLQIYHKSVYLYSQPCHCTLPLTYLPMMDCA